MSTVKTYVAMIIDKSGSMLETVDEARTNFNEQLQVLKEESNAPDRIAKKMLMTGSSHVEGVETKVSIVSFNQKVDEICFDVDVNEIDELTEETYQPDGMTALYDAIGTTIDKFIDEYDLSEDNAGVLFVIVTDGRENSSKLYTRDQVKSKVEELEATGKWTFTFMGTEDAFAEAEQLGFGLGNTVTWDNSTKEGVMTASVTTSNALRSYYNTRMTGDTSVADFYSSVTEEEEDQEEEKETS